MKLLQGSALRDVNATPPCSGVRMTSKPIDCLQVIRGARSGCAQIGLDLGLATTFPHATFAAKGHEKAGGVQFVLEVTS